MTKKAHQLQPGDWIMVGNPPVERKIRGVGHLPVWRNGSRTDEVAVEVTLYGTDSQRPSRHRFPWEHTVKMP